jgi:hypothetical protein
LPHGFTLPNAIFFLKIAAAELEARDLRCLAGMKRLSLFAMLFAVSAFAHLAWADVAGNNSCGGVACKGIINEKDGGACIQPDAEGSPCSGDAGVCGYNDPGCEEFVPRLQCLAPQVHPEPKKCDDGGCSMAANPSHSPAAVPAFLFTAAAVAYMIDRKRRAAKKA